MKIKQQDIDYFRSRFAVMQNKDDLIQLLNEAKSKLYNNKLYNSIDKFYLGKVTNPKFSEYSEKLINEFSNTKSESEFISGFSNFKDSLNFVKNYNDTNSDSDFRDFSQHYESIKNFIPFLSLDKIPDFSNRYRTFIINKKSGGVRIIHAPSVGLRNILRALNFILQCVFEPHSASNGFVINKSVVDNAKLHIGKKFVYNIDIKDFFYSFDRNRVKMGFMYEPFNLKGNREPLAFLLSSLCTHPIKIEGIIKTVLPQGSPTSPTITNILCYKLDKKLTGLANRFSAKYSRYADDITFSSDRNIFIYPDFLKELSRIIEDVSTLQINPIKTRLQNTNMRQEVTGLVVNERVNVKRSYLKQLRMWLYYWEKYGYKKADDLIAKDHIADKRVYYKHFSSSLFDFIRMISSKGIESSTAYGIGNGEPTLEGIKKRLIGKLGFLKMVRGINDPAFNKLKKRFDKLNAIVTSEPEIKDIKNEIQLNQQKPETGKKNPVAQKKNILPRPKETHDFLLWFCQVEPLKNLTHSFRDNIKPVYNEFISSCYKTYTDKINKHSNIPGAILTYIEDFFINDNSGWKKKDFVDWYNKPENLLHPISDDQSDEGWSKKLIRPFCEKIEAKSGGELLTIIEDSLTNALGDSRSHFHIIKDDVQLNTAEFYTDTIKLGIALSHIFGKIKKMTRINPRFYIAIEYINDSNDNFKKLIITHIDSNATKNSYDPNFVKGDLTNIISNLWGLCNYEITANFPDGTKKLILLTDQKEHIHKIRGVKCFSQDLRDGESVKGFTHILKFY